MNTKFLYLDKNLNRYNLVKVWAADTEKALYTDKNFRRYNLVKVYEAK